MKTDALPTQDEFLGSSQDITGCQTDSLLLQALRHQHSLMCHSDISDSMSHPGHILHLIRVVPRRQI